MQWFLLDAFIQILVLHIVGTDPAVACVRQVLFTNFRVLTLTKLSVDAISSSSTVVAVEVSGPGGS